MIKRLTKIREQIIAFASRSDAGAITAAIAAGLFPVLYYYNHNFFFVNSWEQLGFFLVNFLGIPIVVFVLIKGLFENVKLLKVYSKYSIPILNFITFSVLIVISTKGFHTKYLLLAIVGSVIVSYWLWKYINKIIVFQYLLVLVVAFKLVPKLYGQLTYSRDWMVQEDTIEQVQFKKTPNIYLIQADGYTSFGELKRGHYNYDNSKFEAFLKTSGFELYPEYRSNYYSTLSSNMSLFSMKHHYYNNPKKHSSEVVNARSIISGDNPVVSIFNTNNYHTSLLIEKPYLLCNRPTLYYDESNIDYSDLPYLARGFETTIDIYKDLENAIDSNASTNNFYFVQKMLPRHISAFKRNSIGKEKERNRYFKNLEAANEWLTKTVNMINSKDPNSVIIIMADHGGFVGLEYSTQCRTKQTDPDIIKSVFSSALAIKWPDANATPHIESGVNLFRVLFSYLGENDSYLDHLQDDKSFLIIDEGAPYGVYETIDNEGNVVFNKVTN
ncbi:hypothetical protein [uncultured Psychroserpens sp.]|uniref:hypothetical protein n=1 Tax=uncultured Psychroserpens sp. TaxID=255436 RepID=UPI002607D990|nr:hypothetical protein [uncultured Psychroserpens sp.]